jgi:hypothetical protein
MRGRFLAVFMLMAALPWLSACAEPGAAPRPGIGLAARVVAAGGVNAILITPEAPRGAVILMTGGDGRVRMDADGGTRNDNSLVRNRMVFAGRGFAVLVPEPDVNLASAVEQMRAYGPVTLAGTSRGTQRAARGIAAGARPDRLVLTSGLLSDASGDPDNAEAILGTPAALPPTLIVHHRQDGCRVSSPAGVAPFLAWAGGRARVIWLEGGRDEGNPCQSRGHHGFHGIDGPMVDAVASGFATR